MQRSLAFVFIIILVIVAAFSQVKAQENFVNGKEQISQYELPKGDATILLPEISNLPNRKNAWYVWKPDSELTPLENMDSYYNDTSYLLGENYTMLLGYRSIQYLVTLAGDEELEMIAYTLNKNTGSFSYVVIYKFNYPVGTLYFNQKEYHKDVIFDLEYEWQIQDPSVSFQSIEYGNKVAGIVDIERDSASVNKTYAMYYPIFSDLSYYTIIVRASYWKWEENTLLWQILTSLTPIDEEYSSQLLEALINENQASFPLDDLVSNIVTEDSTSSSTK